MEHDEKTSKIELPHYKLSNIEYSKTEGMVGSPALQRDAISNHWALQLIAAITVLILSLLVL